MVISVHLIDKLPVEINQPFEFFSDQASHALVDFIFLLFNEFLCFIHLALDLGGLGSHPEI